MVSPTLSWLSGCVLALWHRVALCGSLVGSPPPARMPARRWVPNCRAQRHGAGTRRHQEQYISGNTALFIKFEGLTLNSALVRTVFMFIHPGHNVGKYQNFGRGARHGVGTRRHGRLRRLLPNPPCCPSSPNLQET